MSAAAYTLIAPDRTSLKNLVPITPDRMAAQQVFRGDGASLIRLAFRAGQVMREHSAPKPILVQVLEGRVLFTIGDTELDMRDGAVVHVDARVMHEVTAVEDSHLLLTLCG